MAGSSTPDTTPVHTLTFADVDLADSHTVSVSINTAEWSANPFFVPGDTLADLQTALQTVLHDSTGTGIGSVDWSFSLPDRDLDFLGVGDTLTIVYDVTVSDGVTSSTQQVTITATGAADPMVVNPVTATIIDSAVSDTGTVVAAGNAIIDVLDNPGDAALTLSITAVNGQAANVGADLAGAYGTLVVEADGTYRLHRQCSARSAPGRYQSDRAIHHHSDQQPWSEPRYDAGLQRVGAATTQPSSPRPTRSVR